MIFILVYNIIERVKPRDLNLWVLFCGELNCEVYMLLVIDIGNTNIHYGIYDEKLLLDWRISTDRQKTSDEYGLNFLQILNQAHIEKIDIRNVMIASVVPDLNSTFQRASNRYLEIDPLFVDTNFKMNISNCYHTKESVGADRLVNACQVVEKYGTPAIIVDLGTAITFDYISEKQEYIGGVIAPGIGISSQALFQKTSRLPKVELENPDFVVGKNTNDSIQSGFVHGFIGLIDSIIEKILEEQKLKEEETQIIATGGYSLLISKQSKYIQNIDRTLTLDGLYKLFQWNRENNDAKI